MLRGNDVVLLNSPEPKILSVRKSSALTSAVIETVNLLMSAEKGFGIIHGEILNKFRHAHGKRYLADQESDE